MSLNNVGALHDAQEKYVDAELLFIESRSRREQKLGNHHPWTIEMRQWLDETRFHLKTES